MFALSAALAAAVFAQDVKAVLNNAVRRLGNPGSIEYPGTGKAGTLRQSLAPNVVWPMAARLSKASRSR